MADDTQQPAPPAGGGSQTRGAAVPAEPPESKNILIQGEDSQPGENGLTADEERQLADLQAKAAEHAARGGVVELKVEGPHAAMTHANVTVGTDWTRVPGHLVPAIETAAAGAGVKLTRKE